jgi:hypothetical protein
MPKLRYLARARLSSSPALFASPLTAIMSPRVREPWTCRAETNRCASLYPSYAAASAPSQSRLTTSDAALTRSSSASEARCSHFSRTAKCNLCDVKGSLGLPGRQRLAVLGARRRGELRHANLSHCARSDLCAPRLARQGCSREREDSEPIAVNIKRLLVTTAPALAGRFTR